MIIAPIENAHLNPCKECGSIRIKLKVHTAYSNFYYPCVKCGCASQSAKSIPEAAAKWNAEMTNGEAEK